MIKGPEDCTVTSDCTASGKEYTSILTPPPGGPGRL